MESGPREDGVERRERELREAEAAARIAAQQRGAELVAAVDRLEAALKAHLAQETQLPILIQRMRDSEGTYLEGVVHFDGTKGVWHKSVFRCGPNGFLDPETAPPEITYFLTILSDRERPEPIGAKRISPIAGGSLAAVVTGCVQVAIEEMARERFAGAEVISWEEAGKRLDERERRRTGDAGAKPVASGAKKAPGCWVLLGWAFVALFVLSVLRSVVS